MSMYYTFIFNGVRTVAEAETFFDKAECASGSKQ